MKKVYVSEEAATVLNLLQSVPNKILEGIALHCFCKHELFTDATAFTSCVLRGAAAYLELSGREERAEVIYDVDNAVVEEVAKVLPLVIRGVTVIEDPEGSSVVLFAPSA